MRGDGFRPDSVALGEGAQAVRHYAPRNELLILKEIQFYIQIMDTNSFVGIFNEAYASLRSFKCSYGRSIKEQVCH